MNEKMKWLIESSPAYLAIEGNKAMPKTVVEQAEFAATADWSKGSTSAPIIAGRPSLDELRECCRILEAAKAKHILFAWEDETSMGFELPPDRVLRSSGWLIQAPSVELLPNGNCLVKQTLSLGVWDPQFYQLTD